VATGTGSGKTECFLLPLLDHCRLEHAEGSRGIKAILIYPMNALATDQARRIAQLIHATPALAGLRAGLHIAASDDAPTAAMSATSVITDKAALHKAPPDILLTNYKQLDYLLLQPQVQSLWAHNGRLADGRSTLRYLVVDEFHTFDGAQGTDLACLIRRLRDRLQCPGEELVCVGTSATLGGPESRQAMLHYAGQIFASPFEPAALIEEERLTAEAFFREHSAWRDEGLRMLPLPALDQTDQLDPDHAVSADHYLATQAALWLGEALPLPPEGDVHDTGWRLELGRQLGTLPAVHNLVRQAEDTCSIEELLERFSRQLGIDGRYPLSFRVVLLDSLLALMAHARGATGQSWVQLRVKVWLRELKRMVASLVPIPELVHSDDIDSNDGDQHLPVVHCRDCGATGWSSTLLPLQLFIPVPLSPEEATPRRVLPKGAVTPLLHEALVWHGFQLEEQPLSCQDVPAWLMRMRDRQLALPLGPGLLDPGWLEAQGLELHPDQPPLLEQLWLLLPEGRVRSSREARHLIRTLRLRLAKLEEELLDKEEAFVKLDD
jgi:DEAD/DEAH box helicase domain-containing protein